MNVLVTDGETRSALAATRSLGRKGCRVIVASSSAKSISSSSRFCSKGIEVPDPLTAADRYVDAIADIVAQEDVDFIFPMTEQTICLLNPVRDRFPEKTVLACPPVEQMEAVSDKARLCRLAESLGVPVPHTEYVRSAIDLERHLPNISMYPVVIKPAASRVREEEKFLSGSVMYARSVEELRSHYDSNPVLRHPSLIQEKITGPGTGLFTIFDGKRHRVLFSHRRLREKPPTGGVSVLSESVALDNEMVASAEKLLSSVGWRGVAMVEFKRDERDGVAKLMEINGRFWGSLQLAISSGVDFPALLLDFLSGNSVSDEPDYRIGHRLKWFFGTLDHLVIRLKNRDGLQGGGSVLPPIWEFLKVFEADTSFDVYDREDPVPFYVEAGDYFRNLFQ